MSGLACSLVDTSWLFRNVDSPYFFQGIFEDMYVWEDAYFCRLIKLHEGKIFGDPRVRTGHLMNPLVVDDSNVKDIRKLHHTLNHRSNSLNTLEPSNSSSTGDRLRSMKDNSVKKQKETTISHRTLFPDALMTPVSVPGKPALLASQLHMPRETVTLLRPACVARVQPVPQGYENLYGQPHKQKTYV